jgi:hypothetical protein
MVPALRAALVCEAVLTEPDGVHSAIRIFNRLALAPGDVFDAKLLLMFANVEPTAHDEHAILLNVESATSEILGGTELTVSTPLEAGETFSVILPFRFQAPAAEGMYWLRLAFDSPDQVLTRLPIHFRHPG